MKLTLKTLGLDGKENGFTSYDERDGKHDDTYYKKDIQKVVDKLNKHSNKKNCSCVNTAISLTELQFENKLNKAIERIDDKIKESRDKMKKDHRYYGIKIKVLEEVKQILKEELEK